MSRTVLVVDDEAPLLRLMTRLVEKAGRPALGAATGAEARALFEDHAEAIGLVLLDVTMPDGDGAERLLPEFVAVRPDLEVIVTSGEALPEPLAAELTRVGGHYIRKPFTPRALQALLEADPSSGVASTSKVEAGAARASGGPVPDAR